MQFKKLSLYLMLTIVFLVMLNAVEGKKSTSDDVSAEEAPAAEEDSSDSGSTKKKGKKGKSKAVSNIDTSDLEGVWDTSFYFNHTNSRVVARSCQKEDSIAWTISGTQWTQSHDVDPLYNSNGRFTIKEIVRTDSINFVKIELLKNSIDSIEPCIGFMREGTKLFMMFNSTNPATCPQKFQFFNDVCSNTVDYSVSECKSGKCLTDLNKVTEQKTSNSQTIVLKLSAVLAFVAVHLFL